jgi:hypothetical protein
MIRVAGPKQPQEAMLPEEAQLPPEEVQEELPPPQPEKRFSADKVPQPIVVYMTSDMGPFMCSNCQHFQEDGSCSVVEGQIDPAGICHVFTPRMEESPEEEVAPTEEVPEEEAPVVEG